VFLLHATTGFTAGRKAANGYCTLGYRIDLAIRSAERGEQQGPPLQALGIAHRGHEYIDMPTGPGKRWQSGRHHDNGSVAGANFCGIDSQAHSAQHRTDCLTTKTSIVAVSRAI